MFKNTQLIGNGTSLSAFTLPAELEAKIGIIYFDNTTGSTQTVVITSGSVTWNISIPNGYSTFTDDLYVSASTSLSINAPTNVTSTIHYFELPVDAGAALTAAQQFMASLPAGVIDTSASDVNTYSSNLIESKLSTKLDKVNPVISSGSLTEVDYVLTGTVLDPSLGGIQYVNLSSNITYTEILSNGQSMVLMIDGGATYVVTMPTITWVTPSGNIAPTFTGTKDTLVIWKQQGTLFGTVVGNGV